MSQIWQVYTLAEPRLKVTPWCCTPTPLKHYSYQVSTSYILVSEIRPRQNFKGQGHCDKVKGQLKATSSHWALTPLTNVPSKNILPTLYHFWDKVTLARSKVKSRSYHDIAHTHPLTNVPTMYQFLTTYNMTRFLRSTARSKVKSRSHQNVDTCTL